ncbi:hypothetical protein [Candidatus Chloroploca asiatica]|uniref:VCBS repeat-containing protein n=1 Tax=Candidatus Chloroploca asiatica TaxID=1506545 RepID=A0A2H3KN53_9CHLR|nr:hypothetical protein [Candidatus Chloroploca asiatica]PDV99507.1 hypothetical protein A9Q02_12000 [Candidatus Chloroploca asiatica]
MAAAREQVGRSNSTAVSRLPGSISLVAYIVTLLLVAMASYVVIDAAVGWTKERLDDVRYGRPRTTHIEGFVGHPAEDAGRPTRFIGLNLDRQVVILALPGGDATHVQSLPGPYLFGAREDLTPVILSLYDLDRDGRLDLLATVRNEHVIYLNRAEGFRLPTLEEQQQMMQEQGL